MKKIKEIGWYELDGKVLLIVGEGYNGNPLIMHQYDVLICANDTYVRFEEELVPKHERKKGWIPVVRFI